MTETPVAIARYFNASAENDIDKIVASFTETATVHDESQQYDGEDAIRRWRQGVASKYVYTSSVRAVEETAPDEFAVQTRLIGNFPGGVVDLSQVFTLRGGLIDSLRI